MTGSSNEIPGVVRAKAACRRERANKTTREPGPRLRKASENTVRFGPDAVGLTRTERVASEAPLPGSWPWRRPFPCFCGCRASRVNERLGDNTGLSGRCRDRPGLAREEESICVCGRAFRAHRVTRPCCKLHPKDKWGTGGGDEHSARVQHPRVPKTSPPLPPPPHTATPSGFPLVASHPSPLRSQPVRLRLLPSHKRPSRTE